MARIVRPSPVCPVHGKPTKRAECRACNAAYMREYMWRRSQSEPDRAMWLRAKNRAAVRGIPFSLNQKDVIIPASCPVLGIPLRIGRSRSPYSPSLDRIDPNAGYVPGNVRVISDRANRLKSDRNIDRLRARAAESVGPLKSEFRKLVQYVEREALLREARAKAEGGKQGAREWQKIVNFLDRVFSRGQLVEDDVDLEDTNSCDVSDGTNT